MITGDHATTAGAIAKELGIEGQAITGTTFAAMSDEELTGAARRISAWWHGSLPRTRSVLSAAAPRERQHRGHDRRWRQRRSCAEGSRYRRRHGHHRNRGLQRGSGDDPHRRQLRHHRERSRVRPGAIRQPAQVPAFSDVDPGRLHRPLHRCRRLRHSRRDPTQPAADLVAEYGRRYPDRHRARFRRALHRADGSCSPSGRRTRPFEDRLGPTLRPGVRDDCGLAGRLPVGRAEVRAGRSQHHAAHHAVPLPPCRRLPGARPAKHDLRPTPITWSDATPTLRHRAPGDHRGHDNRLLAADSWDRRSQPLPMVDVRRVGGDPRRHRGVDQVRGPTKGAAPRGRHVTQLP